MAVIYFPAAFSKKTGKPSMAVEAGTLFSCLEQILEKYPSLRPYLFSDNQLAPFVKIFINQVDSNKLSGLNTNVQVSDELQIVLAIAGG